jgi:hypothetical protein
MHDFIFDAADIDAVDGKLFELLSVKEKNEVAETKKKTF